MTTNGIGFFKKVGIVCGALLAVGALMHMIGVGANGIAAMAWVHAMKPVNEHLDKLDRGLAEEAAARRQSDSLILANVTANTQALVAMSADRPKIVREMMALDDSTRMERTRQLDRDWIKRENH